MSNDEYGIAKRPSGEMVSRSIVGLLDSIRPVWKGRRLIERVLTLLPVDPSSACQRLFNAAIRDLKEKILVIGLDLATEAANNYKLPPLHREEDVFEYSTARVIDLCYRMGILTRPEWRRLHRAYEIRRDLEHEDCDYEAVPEDCFYIFKSTIDIVLSQDPIQLLRITDVKQAIESSVRVVMTDEFLDNYERAPKLRQREISLFLISTAGNREEPDIVRENAVEVLRHIKARTDVTVTIELANFLEERIKTKSLDLTTAKIGHACGATPYFKKVRLKDFYTELHNGLRSAGTEWRKQGQFMEKFEDIGGLSYCPQILIPGFIKSMTLVYIGEPGGYGMGRNRAVFFSDSAAPIVARIFKKEGNKIIPDIEALRQDKDVIRKIEDKHIMRRFEALIDLASQDVT